MNLRPSDNPSAKGIRISMHPDITLELGKNKSNFISRGWKTTCVDWSEESLRQVVTTAGVMPGILKDGQDRKLNENISGFQSVMLDFDDGSTFTEAIEIVKGFDHSAYLFTSVNHGKDKMTEDGKVLPAKDRYRMWIPLSREVSPAEFELVGKYFKSIYPMVDKSFDTKNRYFAPTDAKLSYFHEGQFLEVDYIVEFVSNKDKARNNPPKKDTFSREDYIVLADGTSALISGITERTPVICSFCDEDKRNNPGRHNAFISLNKQGVYYQYCSSEDVTRWEEPQSVNYANSDLFFSEDTGTVMAADPSADSPLHAFRSQYDWKNYCYHNKIDPQCQYYLPRLRATFNPKIPYGVNLEQGLFNIYQEPEIISRAFERKIESPTMEWLVDNCPNILKVLYNLLGNTEMVMHFLNWVAYIVARKEKPFTTFLIVSTPGAGKGLLFERVLSKLVGENQSELIYSERLGERFNGKDAHLILKAVDELFAPNSLRINESRKQFIKSDIGSTWKTVESKGVDSFKVPNYMSYILFSNVEGLAFAIDQKDRRFNVVHNKESFELAKTDWWPGRETFARLIDSEIEMFATYLVSMEVDTEKANTALMTDAKQIMQNATEEDSQTFIRLIANQEWESLFSDCTELSDRIDEIIKECSELKGIPTSYMKTVMESMLGSNRLSMRKRLTAQGLFQTTAKDNNGKSIRVYRARL